MEIKHHEEKHEKDTDVRGSPHPEATSTKRQAHLFIHKSSQIKLYTLQHK